MNKLQYVFWAVGIGLQLLLISALVRGAYKRFPFLLVYVLSLFFTTVIEVAAAMDRGILSQGWASYFWIGELVRQSALYALVFSLLFQAMPDGPKKGPKSRLLALFALSFWAGSLYFSYDPRLGAWMTTVVRNLSFCSTILNLILWVTLLGTRTKDRQLLMITGGLGVMMAGDAIGHSVRQLTRIRAVILAGGIFTVLTNFLCLYICSWALKKGGQEEKLVKRAV